MKTISEYQRAREPSPAPLNVMLETSAICNLSCPMCPRQSANRKARHDGLMGYRRRRHPPEAADTFHRVVGQFQPDRPERLAMFFSGEPLLHPRIIDMCHEAKHDYRMPNVRLYTNGTTLTDDGYIDDLLTCGLDRLIVSLECNEAAERLLRVGADYHQVRCNLLRTLALKRASRRPTAEVMVQHLVCDGVDEREVRKSAAAWRQMGVPVRIAGMNSFAGQVTVQDRRRRLPACQEIWTNCIVSWQGEVTPCCIDHGFKLSFGNLLASPISELWHGDRITNIRNQHLHFNATGDASGLPTLCRRCLRVEETPL